MPIEQEKRCDTKGSEVLDSMYQARLLKLLYSLGFEEEKQSSICCDCGNTLAVYVNNLFTIVYHYDDCNKNSLCKRENKWNIRGQRKNLFTAKTMLEVISGLYVLEIQAKEEP